MTLTLHMTAREHCMWPTRKVEEIANNTPVRDIEATLSHSSTWRPRQFHAASALRLIALFSTSTSTCYSADRQWLSKFFLCLKSTKRILMLNCSTHNALAGPSTPRCKTPTRKRRIRASITNEFSVKRQRISIGPIDIATEPIPKNEYADVNTEPRVRNFSMHHRQRLML